MYALYRTVLSSVTLSDP